MKPDQTNAVQPAPPGETDGPATGLAGRILEWSARHPALAIILVSLLAVVINCYPVIFCGKSFASSTGVPMVYELTNDLKPAKPRRDLGDPEAIKAAKDAVAKQTEGIKKT